jgi:hypothetical protein
MLRKKGTIYANGEKITIISKPKDWKPLNDCGAEYNFGGYYVWKRCEIHRNVFFTIPV